MAETNTNKPPEAASPKSGVAPSEISLEDIDRILEEDDPEFAVSLGELRTVGVEGEVVIESAVAGEEILSVESEETRKQALLARFPALEKILQPYIKIKARFYTHWLKARANFIILGRQILVYARTVPNEGRGYLKAMAKAARQLVNKGLDVYAEMPWSQRVPLFAFLGLALGLAVVLRLNLHGVWLPVFNKPSLSNFADVADSAQKYDPATETIPFLQAFSQEQHAFLFQKVVVNLRRTSEGRNPMVALEFVVEMDSKDSAIEVKMREKELHDRIQRTVEEQTYKDLDSRLGKERLKDLIRKDLNATLTQGWVRDVFIKTFILKP